MTDASSQEANSLDSVVPTADGGTDAGEEATPAEDGGQARSTETAVATRNWQSPILLATTEGLFTGLTPVTLGPHGGALVVWDELRATNFSVRGRHYDGSTGVWGASELIGVQETTHDSVMPDLAVDGAGNAFVVWLRQSTDLDDVSAWMNFYDATQQRWGEAGPAGSGAFGGLARVAASQAGDALVVWSEFGWLGFAMRARRYDGARQQWLPVENISAPGQIGGAIPALDRDGNALVVWASGNGITYSVWAMRYDAPAGRWTAPRRLSPESKFAAPSAIAFSDSGVGIAAWQQQEGKAQTIWASSYHADDDTWSAPVRLGGDRGISLEPQVAVDESGNAMVAWLTVDERQSAVWTNRYLAAQDTWEGPQLMQSDKAETAEFSRPRLGAARDGSGIVVWGRLDNLLSETRRFTLWTRHYDPAEGLWHPAATIADEDSKDLLSPPALAVAPNGDAVAVWNNEGRVSACHYR